MNPKSGKAGKAVPPATPDKAEDADVADPGKVAEIKTEQRQTKTGKYGSEQVKPFKPPQTGAIATGTKAGGAAAGKQATEQLKEEEKNKSWIEIELLDDRNEPIPGEKYRITVPDGRVAEGTLDEKGCARLEGFEPGECKVSFPDLDKDVWDFVEAKGPKVEE